jgi:hypothetical protein
LALVKKRITRKSHHHLIYAFFKLNGLSESNVADPDPGSGALWTPGSGMGKKSRSGFAPKSYFPELRKSFVGLKLLKFFDADPDPESV